MPMNQVIVVIGMIIGLFVLVWVVTYLVFMVQWAAAGCLWFYQAILVPSSLYFSPAFLILSISIGVYWGSYVAARNYFVSLKNNVVPKGKLKKFVRYYVTSILFCFLISMYFFFAVSTGILVYEPAVKYGTEVCAYYAAIKFPAFNIVFPFWK